MRGSFLATAILLTFGLAGCVGGTPASAPSVAPEVAFDEATGGIEGLVHDDSLSPIANAQVALAETGLFAVTDETGQFTLSNVPPGEHQLFAVALGYESVGKRVTVEAGQVTAVDLALVILPINEPWMGSQNQRGLFGCGASWRPQDPATGGGIAACGVLSIYAND